MSCLACSVIEIFRRLMNGSAEGRRLPNRNPLSFMRRNTTKKIEIRTTARFASPARRTAAWALCVTFSDTRPEVEPAKEPFPS
jgi:hypothetical protein